MNLHDVEVELLRATFIAGQPVAAGSRCTLSVCAAQALLDCNRAQLVPAAGVDAQTVAAAATAFAMTAAGRSAWGGSEAGAALKKYDDNEMESRVPNGVAGGRQHASARRRTGRGAKATTLRGTSWSTTPAPDDPVECVLLDDVSPRVWLPATEAHAAVAAGRAIALPRSSRRHASRCQWAEAALAALVPRLELVGAFMPPGRRLSVAFRRLDAGLLGQCAATRWNWSAISVSSEHEALQHDARAVVHVLAHEALHAADDLRSGHAGLFAHWAARLGLVASDAVTRGRLFNRIIDRVLAEAGEMPPLD